MSGIYENNVPEWSDYKVGESFPSMNELLPMSEWPSDERSASAKKAVENFIELYGTDDSEPMFIFDLPPYEDKEGTWRKPVIGWFLNNERTKISGSFSIGWEV